MIEDIFNFIDLHDGEEDKKKVLENVTANISFRGSNLWILASAIVVASVGLNVNSTAVIIGAMLISPLMGPIVGAGFALGTYDFILLKKSFKNLLIATFVSLVVSTIYFFISPFKEMQSELLARTAPNIYDVLIAFFGGLVGVIAITRVEKGNPIPGVAIATALMPPLCTAGYGVAVGNWQYFLGAFYLYAINCFFICISTFFIVKYLKYPPVADIDPRHAKQIRHGISFLILVMILPSFYLAYNLLNEKRYHQKVEEFINYEFTNRGYTVIYKKISFNTKPKKVELAFLNKKFAEDEIKDLNARLVDYKIENTELTIKQDETNLKAEILNELSDQNKIFTQKDVVINNLQRELAGYKVENPKIFKEINIIFPQMKNISIGKHLENNPTGNIIKTVLIYNAEEELGDVEMKKLKLWLKEKFDTQEVLVIRY